MKKIFMFSFIVLLFSGCGGDEDYGVTPYYITYDETRLPKSFNIQVQNVSTQNLKYWLEDKNHKKIFERKVSKKFTEKIICSEYSNENSFIAYDCLIVFSDKDREKEKKEIILEKNMNYSFKFSGNIPYYRQDTETLAGYTSVKKEIATFILPNN